MQGIHLLGEFYDCPAQAEVFCRAPVLRELCLRLSRDAGLTIVGDSFHQFEPQGVTGTVLLAESHLALHTWPEHSFGTIDVYVCNHTVNNAAKAEQLFEAIRLALNPRRMTVHRIERGTHEC